MAARCVSFSLNDLYVVLHICNFCTVVYALLLGNVCTILAFITVVYTYIMQYL